MKTLNVKFFAFVLLMVSQQTNAQIGYQVSLLNSATGEPRAGETVNISITLTNSANAIIYSQTQSATTNDFGILSLAIGNASTFSSVDWNKLPLFISAYADGKLIGRSQILTVPVSEYAKKARHAEYADTADYAHRTGVLTKEMLEGTWTDASYSMLSFGSETVTKSTSNSSSAISYIYYIDGNHIHLYNEHVGWETFHYIPKVQVIQRNGYGAYRKQ